MTFLSPLLAVGKTELLIRVGLADSSQVRCEQGLQIEQVLPAPTIEQDLLFFIAHASCGQDLTNTDMNVFDQFCKLGGVPLGGRIHRQ